MHGRDRARGKTKGLTLMINELNQPEIKKILADNTLGRLGCISDGEPYVVPVYQPA